MKCRHEFIRTLEFLIIFETKIADAFSGVGTNTRRKETLFPYPIQFCISKSYRVSENSHLQQKAHDVSRLPFAVKQAFNGEHLFISFY